jgi:hypothetical protein
MVTINECARSPRNANYTIQIPKFIIPVHTIQACSRFKKIPIVDTREPIVFFFFYIHWCPISMLNKIVWDKFTKLYDDSTFGNSVLRCRSVNCSGGVDKIDFDAVITQNDAVTRKTLKTLICNSDNFNTEIKQHDVETCPTVKLLLHNGVVIEYPDRIYVESLHDFVCNNLVYKSL